MTLIRTYTTAEPAYDGFGTQTVRVVGKTNRGRPVRLVETPEPHANWQRARYASGLNLVADQHQWDELLTYGLAEETP